ncbi:unnamed protein product [Clonostachys byssicola]|uniref:Ankyrin n=1 Tax=Clonostachys byssicola TaxID=160290 RepID=A0A9N9XVI0_9HYPO|nr:unnamed protein product [Clonostachys byssicola]
MVKLTIEESQLRTLSARLLTACKQGSVSTVRSIIPTLYPAASSSAATAAAIASSSIVPPLTIPLATAASHGQASVLKYLLTSPPCSTSRTPWSPGISTPISSLPDEWKEARYSCLVPLYAVKSKSPSVVQALLDAGMHVDEEIEKMGPPLSIAIRTQSSEMVNFLLDKGADVNGVEWIPPVSFLASAAERPSLDILAALLDHGATLPGSHALRTAAEAGNISAVEMLLERGADIDEVHKWDIYGNEMDIIGTALHEAVENDQAEMVKFLLKRGAKRDVKNGRGETAMDVAEKDNKEEILKILDGNIA